MKETASKIHRPWKCAAALVLPQVESESNEARTEPARNRGQGVHRYLERVGAVGADIALAEVTDKDLHLLCKALPLDKLPTHLACEVAFAWNWQLRTARELGRGADLPRLADGAIDYDVLGVDWSCEVPGTFDVVGMQEIVPPGEFMGTKRGYIGDYKRGRTRYPRPGDFGQTLLGAACLRAVEMCDEVMVELLYIDEDSEVWCTRDLLDGAAIDAFEQGLAERLASRPKLEADMRAGIALPYRTGEHCRYCRSVKHCDATTALVRQVPAELLRLGVDQGFSGELEIAPGSVTVRNAAAVWEAAEKVIDVMHALQREVTALAYAGEHVELSDGRVIERYVTERRHVDGKIAAAVLERKYGRDEAMKAVELKVTLEAIKQCVVANTDFKIKPRPKITGRNGDGVYDMVLKEIELAKGLGVDVSEQCKPRQPTKRLAAGKKSGNGSPG